MNDRQSQICMAERRVGGVGVGVGTGGANGRSQCAGCGAAIRDPYILRVSPDLEWHAGCLRCAECARFLDESCTCFVRDGKTYCKSDYHRLFGAKCSKCGQGFSRSDFVMRARGKIFHIDCFRCIACSRQLIPGDEFAIREDELFCKADHDVLGVGGLVGVGVGIGLGAGLAGTGGLGGAGGPEMKQETPDQSPLPLSPAKGSSQGAGAQTPNGTTSSNGSSGGGGGGGGGPTQLSSLSNDLASQYYSDDSTHGSSSIVYSSVKSELTDAVQSVGGPRGGGGGVGGGNGGCVSAAAVASVVVSGGPPSAGGGHGGAGGGGNGVVGAGGAVRSQGHKSGRGGGEHKPTRVRTVLNEKQLHTLRTCYAANPRPDALMKEQLVEMTGLSPRVIRVWFQNKRCKDKKRSIMIKQMQQSEKDGRQLSLGALRGVPMVATSPVRHEPGQGPLGQPLDIHSYQAPWKTLSDYAVNHPDSDLDPNSPQFRQLVNQMHGYDPSGPMAMPLDPSHTYLSGLDDSTCHMPPRSPSEMSSATSD